jgi:hypothetical protein
MLKAGNIVISKDLNHLFKIGQIDHAFLYAYGFDILHSSELVKIQLQELIEVKPGNALITKLCKSAKVRLDASELFCRTRKEQSIFLGVSPRTVCRIEREYDPKEKV